VGDKETAKLARSIRREEERMANFLGKQIETLAKAVAKEEIPAREWSNGGTSSRRRTSSRSGGGRSSSSRSRSSSGSRKSSSGGGSSRSRRTRASASR
jgi:hypothetical protein